jgi:hypothetical protein
VLTIFAVADWFHARDVEVAVSTWVELEVL